MVPTERCVSPRLKIGYEGVKRTEGGRTLCGREITAPRHRPLDRISIDSVSLLSSGNDRGGSLSLSGPCWGRDRGCITRWVDVRGGTSSASSPFNDGTELSSCESTELRSPNFDVTEKPEGCAQNPPGIFRNGNPLRHIEVFHTSINQKTVITSRLAIPTAGTNWR